MRSLVGLPPVVLVSDTSRGSPLLRLRHAGPVLANDVVAALAKWSPWLPFHDAAVSAPRLPGVYLARQGAAGGLVYVGMAGERRGQGLRGRLTVYRRGKAAVSGLGEAVLDRALADATFVQEHLEQLIGGQPKRAATWARGRLALGRPAYQMGCDGGPASCSDTRASSPRRICRVTALEPSTMAIRHRGIPSLSRAGSGRRGRMHYSAKPLAT
ncbi:hypothetical protein GA0070619_1026 [Micromonospora zamorensis]|nr:hypothetical protein GA0070619_1026 [Micromonospora zamorensis]